MKSHVPALPRPKVSGASGFQQKLRQAKRLEAAGDLAAAQQAYVAALQQHREHPEALVGLGRVFSASGHLEQAILIFQKAYANNPDRVDVLTHFSEAQFLAGDFDEALLSAHRVIDLDERNPRGYVLAARTLNQLNRTDEAVVLVQRGLERVPNDANLKVTAAMIARRSGDLDRARAYIEAVAHRRDIDDVIQRAAFNEYGFVLDLQQEYSRAFEAFENAGKSYARSPRGKRMLRNPWREGIHAMTDGFTVDLLSRFQDECFDANSPAFLVGFPRSGTTMTEQVLAAHPSVTTIEEKPLMQALINRATEIAGRSSQKISATLAALSREQIAELRQFYWEEVRKYSGAPTDGQVVLDKLPLNILAIPTINVIFPDARVLVALRDPRDVCLSCLMQAFNLNEAMVQFVSLDRTTQFYGGVMQSWLAMRELLTLDWQQVRYEDTVRDLETQARSVLVFLGLEWDPSVLDFHEAAKARRIATPSFAAVTERVHTRAIDRWKNYRDQIEPYMDRLRPFLNDFGYADEA